ncbi:MAG: hypothetical protein ABIS51_12345 [Sphingomonas sp.]
MIDQTEPANANAGLRIARENGVADQLSIHRTPNFQPVMTGVAKPFFCTASRSGHQKVWILQNTSSVIILQLLSMN